MQKMILLLAGLGFAIGLQAQSVCLHYTIAGLRYDRYPCTPLTPPAAETRSSSPAKDIRPMTLAPNPTEGHFTLYAEDLPPEARVFIFDASGKLVLQSRLGDGRFNLATLPADLYVVKVVWEGEERVSRLEKTTH